MSTPHSAKNQMVYALASITGLILLLVWMQGGFVSKTPPGTVHAAEKQKAYAGATTIVSRQEVDEIMSWPASVSARVTADLAPRVTARVAKVLVKAGDQVKTGQVLAQLDERELQARLAQARSALAAAEAQAVRASADARRVRNLFDKEAATQQSLEAAQAGARTAEAQVAEARAGIAAAESTSSESVVRAPFDGAVVQRLLEPGDMAAPASPVLRVQSGQRLRIEAAIPENCARWIVPGTSLVVRLGEIRSGAKVEEVAPAADTATRTVLIKAALDDSQQVQPGTFGWLEQACERRSVLQIPAAAVTRSGQLESVRLLIDGQPRLRHVRTGKRQNEMVEILSGLKEGDVVAVGGGQ